MITAMLLLAAQAAAAAPPATAKPAAEKMVCQSVYQARSRIPDRLCLTQSEWDKMAEANQNDLKNSRNARSAGLAGTIAPAGSITTPSIPHQHGPGPQ
jgi:hypothetical protein